MRSILPVDKNSTTSPARFAANLLIPHTRSTLQPIADAEFTEKVGYSIRTLIFTQGFGRTLEYLCTFSVFSVLSAD